MPRRWRGLLRAAAEELSASSSSSSAAAASPSSPAAAAATTAAEAVSFLFPRGGRRAILVPRPSAHGEAARPLRGRKGARVRASRPGGAAEAAAATATETFSVSFSIGVPSGDRRGFAFEALSEGETTLRPSEIERIFVRKRRSKLVPRSGSNSESCCFCFFFVIIFGPREAIGCRILCAEVFGWNRGCRREARASSFVFFFVVVEIRNDDVDSSSSSNDGAAPLSPRDGDTAHPAPCDARGTRADSRLAARGPRRGRRRGRERRRRGARQATAAAAAAEARGASDVDGGSESGRRQRSRCHRSSRPFHCRLRRGSGTRSDGNRSREPLCRRRL